MFENISFPAKRLANLVMLFEEPSVEQQVNTYMPSECGTRNVDDDDANNDAAMMARSTLPSISTGWRQRQKK